MLVEVYWFLSDVVQDCNAHMWILLFVELSVELGISATSKLLSLCSVVFRVQLSPQSATSAVECITLKVLCMVESKFQCTQTSLV